MGKCNECAHENVPFYEDPCYWCLRLGGSGLPTFDKFEPKEKENEKMSKCDKCAHLMVPFYKDPCYTCISLRHDKFEPRSDSSQAEEKKEPEICANCKHIDLGALEEPCFSCGGFNNFEPKEKKENAKMKNTEEVRGCDNCQHKDEFVFNEPCLSCLCTAPVYLNFIKKENAEMNNAEDKVNHPSHYTTGEIEVINYIRDKLGCREFTGYCIGNVMKYISRWRHKDGAQDLEKAKVYLQWAIESAYKEESEV